MLRSLSIPAEAAAMSQVLDFVIAFATEHELPHEEVARVSIVLEELLTNTVKYGYPAPDCRGRVEISLEFVEARLTIQFIDDAQEFDPFAVALPEVSDDTDSRPVGGLGLLVVRALADERRYQRDSGRNVIFLARKVSVRSKPKSST
jgi:anti-sigma regulatory factor (Ser/Thr protein kinase)